MKRGNHLVDPAALATIAAALFASPSAAQVASASGPFFGPEQTLNTAGVPRRSRIAVARDGAIYVGPHPLCTPSTAWPR